MNHNDINGVTWHSGASGHPVWHTQVPWDLRIPIPRSDSAAVVVPQTPASVQGGFYANAVPYILATFSSLFTVTLTRGL